MSSKHEEAHSSTQQDDSGFDFLPEQGEAANLIRAYDWASTPMGHPSQWSASLRNVVRFLIANRFPMLLWWGPDYIQLYNDNYAPILGTKHPEQAMGRPFRECWHEVYDILGPMVDSPFNGGPSSWLDDMELIVRRHGFPEESHFTGSYSPVPDDTAPNGIGGVLGTVIESTEKVIAERRVKILSELGARVAAKTDEEACTQAIGILSQHPKDVPFALLYLVDDTTRRLRLVSTCGIEEAIVGPESLDLDSAMSDIPWPLASALAAETMQFRTDLAAILPSVPPGPWVDPPDTVAVVPVKSNVAGRPAGALVVGISACIRLDERYRSFLELVGSQVATAVANARAYDEERRRAEALAEIDRAKTIFFSNVSHEFRTPLTLMLGPLEDALAEPSTPANVRAHLEIAQRNAQRLLKLVNSLLDFARIEAGRIEASFSPVDLSGLTADLSSTFRSAMQRAGLEFEVTCEPLSEPVYVDREMWEKIVLNLLSNAFKFTLHGKVSVRVYRSKDDAMLEVADTGIGVPEHELPRLFDRFHRVENTGARTHEGSGIGLAMVQELVRLHGGEIAVDSTVEVGTRFRVSIPFGRAHLPADRIQVSSVRASTAIASQTYVQEALRWLPDAQAAPGVDHDAQEMASDRRFRSTFGSRIVLADDNADMRAYIRELLGRFYEVETAADGAKAEEAVRRRRPDLLLADVMMPRLDGFQLLKALRTNHEYADIPIILVSARAGEEARIEGLGAGADDYIVKPFHARELLARVGALLELTATRRANEERFRAFVRATSDVVYRMGPDWREMRFLEGRSFIADQTDPSRTWLQKYIHPDDQPQVMAGIENAIRTKSVFELEHRVIRADGSLGWTFSRAIPLLDEAGALVEWFGAASDVTERRETQDALRRQQRQLEEADRQKNEFLAMLAHELRNPLAPIRNAGELLSRAVAKDLKTSGPLATIERQVSHLTRLVDDLLDISRITQGHIELRRRSVQLTQVISQAVEQVEPLVRQYQHRVTITSTGTSLVVNGDSDRLVQCLANLLTNAAKYSPPKSEIRIETWDDKGRAVMRISDNGMGILPELLPNVFDLFVQGARTLDRAQGGLGVGLTIVKRIVEMHGGTITAASAGAGQGSSFEIRLPIALDMQPAAQSSSLTAIRPLRILVVDDNEDGATMLAALLQFDGHQVDVSLSGAEAVETVTLTRPDVVLLDIGLPGMDGYEVARHIRTTIVEDAPRLVAISGYGRDEDRERTRTAGFVAHLVKPVNFEALRRTLDNISV
jgi:signal transduction histidine kinase/response regulator of citrate/malate metabolism